MAFFFHSFRTAIHRIWSALCSQPPATAAISVTLWIAAFCLIAGLFKMLAALIIRFYEWGWASFNGAITFLLGILIYANWPLSGLWVVGLFIGVDLILAGWSWVVLALSARTEQ